MRRRNFPPWSRRARLRRRARGKAGPEKWPLPEHMELDRRFAGMLADGDYDGLSKWLPEFVSAVDAEMGGRHLAMMLGVLREAGSAFTATVHAYGPSSGSGNYAISLASSDSRIL